DRTHRGGVLVQQETEVRGGGRGVGEGEQHDGVLCLRGPAERSAYAGPGAASRGVRGGGPAGGARPAPPEGAPPPLGAARAGRGGGPSRGPGRGGRVPESADSAGGGAGAGAGGGAGGGGLRRPPAGAAAAPSTDSPAATATPGRNPAATCAGAPSCPVAVKT